MANQYKLKQLNDDILKKTRDVWEREVHQTGLPPTQFHRILDWADSHRTYTQGEEFSYAIVKEDDRHASAIMDVVFAQLKPKSAWLKMMEVSLSPRTFDNVLETIDGVTVATHIYAAAVAGCIKLTSGNHKAKTCKLYGRSEALLTFLKSLAAHLKADATLKATPGLSIDMEGRWLVIKRRP